MGILGSNGTGKSTAVGILSGKIKPNLGQVDDPPGWQEIIKCLFFNIILFFVPTPFATDSSAPVPLAHPRVVGSTWPVLIVLIVLIGACNPTILCRFVPFILFFPRLKVLPWFRAPELFLAAGRGPPLLLRETADGLNL